MKKCKFCHREIKYGRSDKLFCNVNCKNNYHRNLRRLTQQEAMKIDRMLHRNHGILFELMKNHKKQIKIPRNILEQKKFRFQYHTHCITNSKGKIYHYIYNYAWMSFSDDEILIIKKR